MSGYYSEKLSGPRNRTERDFDSRAWGGIVALVEQGVATHAYADAYPVQCDDGRGISGTDVRSLALAVEGEHPDIAWPLNAGDLPETPAILDLVEFLHGIVSDPAEGDYHSYFGHHHLSFNRVEGQRLFRDQVNRILARNGLAYELEKNGRARRLLEPVIQERLREGLPTSGDQTVDSLISQAEERFLDPHPTVARDALEKLWDAFERVKTLLDPDKKAGAAALVAAGTTSQTSAEAIVAEMRSLTEIGNSFHIRHHETTKHPVPDELVDYLFVRLYALLRLLLSGLEPDA